MTDDLEKTRTLQQNKSLHKFCEQVAESLNDAGYDFKKFLEVSKYKLDVPWTKDLVKDQLWRVVQEAMTGKESTTELSTIDPTFIHKIVMDRVSALTGIPYIAWPDRFNRGRDDV